MPEKFNAIVIGTGQAGPALCARLDKEGLRTAVLERKLLWKDALDRMLNPDAMTGRP